MWWRSDSITLFRQSITVTEHYKLRYQMMTHIFMACISLIIYEFYGCIKWI